MQVAVQFEWSEKKNRANFLKHELWFELMLEIWRDPVSLEFYDEARSHREDRFLKIGALEGGLVLIVAFTERMDGERIRIISARRASPREKKVYEERIRSIQDEET